ncbi:ABC transporter permease [Paenibacillus senegalensis]|uniref:ABC transporter permease n=1 Tax=Paenibacillus senegalensis TaxID=1465766 RepID=UPI000289CE04|nr:ABC-2 family transporter protein [Paenibacillus senegalensis]
MNELKLYGLLIRASIRSRMQYKFNFIFSSLMALVINVMEFLLIAIILNRFGDIKGWGLLEIGYLYSAIILSRALYRTVASDVHHIERYLVNGEMDQLLTRPIPVLLALMSQNFNILAAEFFQGIIIMTICINGLMAAGQMTWFDVPLTLLMIVCGGFILFTIGLITSTVGFWITRIRDLQNITEDAARNAAQYPISLYPKWMQLILLTVLPVGLVNYVPTLYIIRGEMGPWVIGLVLIFTAGFLWVGLRFWRVGISRYQSTGN